MYTVNADVSQRSLAEAHRKYVETFTTLTNGLARAEKKAEEAERHLEAEKQRADTAEQRANTAEQRADTAEQRANTAEQQLAAYRKKYGDL